MAKITQKNNTIAVKQEGFFRKHATFLCLIVLSVAFLVNYNRIYDPKPDLNGDNIHYYALGKAIANGDGFTNTMGFTETPHTHFPPGYPFFIACLNKLGFKSVASIKIANGVLLYGAVILLFFIFYYCSRSRLVAFTASFFTAFHIVNLRFATIMMSETLFTFLSVVIIAIVLHCKFDTLFTKQRTRKEVVLFIVLLICLGYTYLVRTIGSSLILAVIAYYGIQALRQVKLKNKPLFLRMGLITVFTALVFIGSQTAWSIRDKSVGKTGSNYINEFTKKLNGERMTTLEDWTTRIKNNLRLNITQWIPASIFDPVKANNIKEDERGTTFNWIAGILITATLLFGIFSLQHGFLLIFLYIGMTMGVLLFWPEQFGGTRYMAPIIPFFIFLFLNGCSHLCTALYTKLTNKQIKPIVQFLPWLICITFAFLAAPKYSTAIDNAAAVAKYKDYDAKIVPANLAEYIDAMRWAGSNLPDSARITTRKAELFYLYSGGRKSMGFPNYATPEEIYTYLLENKINYVIIDRWFRHAYVTIIPAVNKYNKSFGIVYEKTLDGKGTTYILQFKPAEEDIEHVRTATTE